MSIEWVYTSLALFSTICFAQRKYVWFALSFFLISTNLFAIGAPSEIVQTADICMIVTVLGLFILFCRKGVALFEWREDKISKFILIFLGFYAVEFVITVATGADTFMWSLKVVRKPMILLSYYLFKEIPGNDYNKIIRGVFIATIIGGVLFIIQYLGVFLLYRKEENVFRNDIGFLNMPEFLQFFLFYALASKKLSKRRILIVAFLFLVLILTFVRGLIFGFFVALFVYLVRAGSKKQIRNAVLLLLVMFPAISYVTETKDTTRGGVSTSEDLKNIFLDIRNIRNLTYTPGDGNMTFRIAMLVERVNYLIDHPENIMLGVGAIHEDSPNCISRFTNFSLGTYNVGRFYEKCLIESGDVVWVPVVLRYGLLGVLIHVYFYFFFYKQTRNEEQIIKILGPLYIWFFMSSFDGDFFNLANRMLDSSFFFALLYKCQYEKIRIE